MPLHAKLSFCICYFWRTKRKSTETILERCFSCQNKSVCQKLVWSCKKMKISQKCDIRPFCTKPFNYTYSENDLGHSFHYIQTSQLANNKQVYTCINLIVVAFSSNFVVYKTANHFCKISQSQIPKAGASSNRYLTF